MLRVSDIQIRDPFVVPVPEEGLYYLFGTTDKNAWSGPGTGFDYYVSKDLEHFEGPSAAFRPGKGFWGSTQFWAPEVHEYEGCWYMFASFKAEGRCRGTQVLVAGHPRGPFLVHSPEPVTPAGWECLDGTLHVDGDGQAWLVFCHEWLQIQDGAMCAVKLAADLTRAVGEPVTLFRASEARWTRMAEGTRDFVTDGPFLHRVASRELLMLWSTLDRTGYALGTARSESGGIVGPWRHGEARLFGGVGGHGMLFRTFEGQLMLTLHSPNNTPEERAVFVPVKETARGLEVG